MKTTTAGAFISGRIPEWIKEVQGRRKVNSLARASGLNRGTWYRILDGKGVNSAHFLVAVATLKPNESQWIELHEILKEAERLRVELGNKPDPRQMEFALQGEAK